jgi:DNA-binding SARP family transcriptional activator/TolB-like protein
VKKEPGSCNTFRVKEIRREVLAVPSRRTYTRPTTSGLPHSLLSGGSLYQLKTLGGLALLDSNGAPAATQRRRLALLALLASAGERGLTRDRLIGLLSADSPTESARHALEQVLSTLRRQLGESVFLGTDPVRINPDFLSSDVTAFGAALERADYLAAAALYQGPFLDGISLPDAGEFERWVDVEREHLRERYAGALEHLAEEESLRGKHAAAVGWWRKLAAADPLGTRGAAGLIRALVAAGDPAGAMQHARVYEALVRQQLDMPLDPSLTKLMEDLRAGRLPTAVVVPAPKGSRVAPAPSPRPSAGIESHPRTAAVVSPRRGGRRRWLGLVALGLIGAAVVLVRLGSPAKPIRIAVLLYENLGTPEDEYFADGLAEEITNYLASTPGVSIIGRTSVLRYKKAPKSPAEIRKELGVDYVLGGTVSWARNPEPTRVRINSSLQRASDNSIVWNASEEGVLGDVFALQANIAEHVLAALNRSLREPERRARRAVPTRNLAAYQEYLLGRSQWVLRTDVNIEAAIGHFERAIGMDSTFAVAYAALADAWVVYPNFWHRQDSTRNLVPSAAEAYRRADRAVRHALALDSTLVEAQAALAYVRFLTTGDYVRALPELQAVVTRDPGSPFARHWLRHAFAAAGRAEEALAQSRMAVELDPLTPLGNTILGVDLAATGHPTEAIEALRRAIEVSPNFSAAYMVLGALLLQNGQREAGANTLRRFLELRGYERVGDSVVAAALAGRGSVPPAVEALDGFVRLDWEPEPRLAGLYALLGAKERALKLLEEAKARRIGELPVQRYQPFFATLRDEPRFKALWVVDAHP